MKSKESRDTSNASAGLVKLIIPSIASIALFAFAIFVVLLPAMEKNLLRIKEDQCKTLTESAWSLLVSFQKMAEDGQVSEAEAQKQALSHIRNLRYDRQRNYFWIQDKSPRMIMHPYLSSLEGKDLNNYSDPSEKKPFREFTDVATRKGGGFVEYMWQFYGDTTRSLHKLSYVKLFEPWGWIIGTGIYLDDVRAEINKIRSNLLIISLVIMSIVIALSLLEVRNKIILRRGYWEAIERVRESNQHYRLLAENATDLIWTTDLNLRFTYISPAVTRLCGYTTEEAIQKSIDEIINADSLVIAKKRFAEALNYINSVYKDRNHSWTDELELICRDGSTVWTEVSFSILRDSQGHGIGFLGVAREITERREAENIRSVFYKITQAIIEAQSLEKLSSAIRQHLGSLIDTTNFYLALYDECDETYAIPFCANESEDNFAPSPMQLKRGLTDYVRRTGKPLLADEELWQELLEEGDIEFVDAHIKMWMGVPLMASQGVIGVMAVQRYSDDLLYTVQDLELFNYISRNITLALDRQKTLDELAKLNHQIKLILDSAGDGICGINSSGIILSANPAAAKTIGMEVADLLGRDIHMIFKPARLNGIPYERELCPICSFASAEKAHSGACKLLGRNDGLVKRIEFISSPLVEAGRVIGKVVAFNDVTEHVKAEEEMQRHLAAMEISMDGIGILDQDEKYTYLNVAHARIYGYERPAELIGKTWRVLYRDDELKRFEQEIFPILQSTGHWQGEAMGMRKDGSQFHQEVSLTGLEGGGLICFVRDISERVKSDREKTELHNRLERAERMESLGILAGGVAHDLNNILGPMMAYPDIIMMGMPEDSHYRNDLLEIQKASQRAADVIQDLLTLARRGKYEIKPVDLNEIVQSYLSSASFVEKRAQHAEIKVQVDLAPDIPNILGSSSHLLKMVMNLVINAFEAMPEKGVLKIQTCRQKSARDNTDGVILKVADTGHGIEAKDMKHIFEPFFTKKKMGRSGSGLGLAVVYGVVKDHKGFTDVKSKPGEGTEFSIFLPATDEVVEDRKESVFDYHGSETVLVVDDVAEQRELAKRLLCSQGYSVVTVTRGQEATEYLRHHAVDLMVLDMILEDDFDGLDTYREIIKFLPGLPTIIASGFSESERVKEAERLGVARYIRKPYTLDEIGRAVRLELDKAASKAKAGLIV